jgi:hypothetical protein
MTVSEIRDLKRRMNVRDSKGWRKKKLNVNACYLNLEEGMVLCAQHDTEDVAKSQKKVEANLAKARKAVKETERQRLHVKRGPVEAFTGSLLSRLKPDLQEIVNALKLLKDGTKQDLLN